MDFIVLINKNYILKLGLNQIHLRIPFICCRRFPSFNDWLIVDKKVCPTFSDMTKKVWWIQKYIEICPKSIFPPRTFPGWNCFITISPSLTTSSSAITLFPTSPSPDPSSLLISFVSFVVIWYRPFPNNDIRVRCPFRTRDIIGTYQYVTYSRLQT